tara:strand:+ start:4779 stop:6005 length:1227 start_codon:yes stop_codon:yes gene_type:complete
MARDEFKPDIKVKLAKRAGYQCSICKRITIGPSDEGDENVNNTGMAAHITAASDGFKRYAKDITPEQRSSINNGIWCCYRHGKLIDGDEADYTIDELKRVKANHEKKIKYLHKGINTNIGIVTSLTLQNMGPIQNKLTLKFDKTTLLWGNNGTGKTLICEAIASLYDPKHLWRWENNMSGGNRSFTLEYFQDSAMTFTRSIDYNCDKHFLFNGLDIPFVKVPFFVVYMDQFFNRYDYEGDDFMTAYAKYFGLEKQQFINLIIQIGKLDRFIVNDIVYKNETYIDDDTSEELKSEVIRVKMNSKSHYFTHNQISGGEFERLTLEIAARICVYYSKFISTVLIIDHRAIPSLDNLGVKTFLDILLENDFDFQTILVLAKNNKSIEKHGVHKIELDLDESGVTYVKNNDFV